MTHRTTTTATPEPYAVAWGSGRRMTGLRGAMALVQIRKLPQIVDHMRASNNRIKAMLGGTPGLGFWRLNDAEGDTGTFLILTVGDEQKALAAVAKMKQFGLHNVFWIADYGLNILTKTGRSRDNCSRSRLTIFNCQRDILHRWPGMIMRLAASRSHLLQSTQIGFCFGSA